MQTCPNCGHVLDARLSDVEFTERQKTVISYVAQGYTAKEIGAIMKISQRTVEFHCVMIRQKLGVDSLAGIIRFGVTHGFV